MKWFVLDTETTGLDETAEIIEISVTDVLTDEVLFNRRCKTHTAIVWPVAESIHGIAPEMLVNEPTFHELWHNHGLKELVMSADKISIFNAEYDVRLIEQSLPFDHDLEFSETSLHCIMLSYAAYKKVPSRRGYKWFSLAHAAGDAGHTWSGPAHSALADCLAAAAVARYLAAASQIW